jgi:hypothetical protein
MNDSPIPNLESETWRRFGPPSQVRPGVVLATEGQDVPVREALFAANAGQPKALPHHGFKISRPESQGGFRAADNDCRRLLASMLQGRQSSVLLTSRPDTADPVDILLVQQASAPFRPSTQTRSPLDTCRSHSSRSGLKPKRNETLSRRAMSMAIPTVSRSREPVSP